VSREKVETPLGELLGEHDAFGQILVVAIVLTTLLAALTGFVQIRALRHHDDAVDRADQWGALASQVGPRWDAAARLQLDRFRLYQEARVRAEQARARAFLGVGPPRDELVLDAARWSRLATQVRRDSASLEATMRTYVATVQQTTDAWLSSVTEPRLVERGGRCPPPAWASDVVPGPVGDGPSRAGPGQDPHFPQRYLADSRREVYLIDALRAGASREAEHTEKQFTEFAVALTLFAVAVFLLGFSLSPYGRPHRRLFATTAAGLVVGASIWAVHSAVAAPRAPSAEAAAAYADGRVALEREGPGDARTALGYFDCAIALDPGFPQAYVDRADAWSSLPGRRDPTGRGGIEIVPLALQERALADLERAEALGAKDPSLPAYKGSYILQRGVQEHDRGRIWEGLDLVRESARVFPDDPIFAFDVAEGELALGRDWHPAFRNAERLAASDPVGWPFFVSRALTDLTQVARQSGDPRTVAQVKLAKEHVVAASDPPQRRTPVAGIRIQRIDVQPGFVEFVLARGTDLDPARDTLDAQWYYSVPGSGVWTGVFDISGRVLTRRGEDQSLFAITPLPRPRGTGCVPSGLYRLELYANGRLATTRDVDARVAPLVSSPLRDMNVSICRPASWVSLTRRTEPGIGVVPGLADGYVSADGSQGILVLDVSPEGEQAVNERGALRLLFRSLQQFHTLVPSGLRAPRILDSPFLGGGRSVTVGFLYPGGRLIAAIGVTNYGRALVGLVFGSESMFTRPVDPRTGSTLADNLAASIVTSDPTTS
jgi:tetratricopeptide (TPR) repeat protein